MQSLLPLQHLSHITGTMAEIIAIDWYSRSFQLANTTRVHLLNTFEELRTLDVPTTSTSTIVLTILWAVVAYRLLVIFQRLYLHPLSSYPGPKLAAATTLYRAYYQIIRDGEHVAQATKLHKKYGV